MVEARVYSSVCSACFLEQAHCQETIPNGTAGTQRRRNKHGFRDFFASRTCLHCVVDVRLDAIGALSSQGDGYGHQFPVLYRDNSVISLRSMFEVKECGSLFGGGANEAGDIGTVFRALVFGRRVFTALKTITAKRVASRIQRSRG